MSYRDETKIKFQITNKTGESPQMIYIEGTDRGSLCLPPNGKVNIKAKGEIVINTGIKLIQGYQIKASIRSRGNTIKMPAFEIAVSELKDSWVLRLSSDDYADDDYRKATTVNVEIEPDDPEDR